MKEKSVKKTVLLLLFVLFNSYLLFNQVVLHPYNLSFEEGFIGELPTGWTLQNVYSKDGYKAYKSNINPKQGNYCLELSNDSLENSNKYGTVYQMIKADGYQGKKLKFRAAVRAELTGTKSSAHLLLQVQLNNDQTGFAYTMSDKPIVMGDWDYYEFEADIDNDAKIIKFGLILNGTGKAWIDDASLEVINDFEKNFATAKQLEAYQIENLATFIKLTGYIRYFYPSKESILNNWDDFTINGLAAVENSKSEEELVQSLNNLFLPIAPALKVNTKISKPKPFKYLPDKNALKNVAVVYSHTGPPIGEVSIFSNNPINIYQSSKKYDGTVTHIMNVGNHKGKKIRLSSMIKIKQENVASQAQLIIGFSNKLKRDIGSVNMNDNPVQSIDWKKYSLETVIPPETEIIHFGLTLIGDGIAWFDDVKISIIDEKDSIIELKSYGFEDFKTGMIVNEWRLLNSSSQEGYKAEIINKNSFAGKQCLEIASDIESKIQLPEIGEIFKADISKNITIQFPLCLYTDSIQTLPYPPKDIKPMQRAKPEGFVPAIEDRYSRYMIISQLWNFAKHFSLYNDSIDYWNDILYKVIEKSSYNNTQEDFLETLKIIMAGLKDGQARIWSSKLDNKFSIPISYEFIDKKLIVTNVYDSTISVKIGDEILEMELLPIKKLIDIYSSNVPYSTEQWKVLRTLIEIKAGSYNSKMPIKYKNSLGEIKAIELKRNININDIIQLRPDVISKIDDTIYYVDLTRMTDELLKKQIKYINDAKGIIFDLRGTTSISEHFLGFFIDNEINSLDWKIPIYTKPDKQVKSNKIIHGKIKPINNKINSKIVFIADERSIGQTESILNIIAENKIGDIFGRKTAGNAGEVFVGELPCNLYFSMTCVNTDFINNTATYSKPVIPNKLIDNKLDYILEKRDIILESAYQFLKNN